VLKKSSEVTLLDDDTLITRFDVDKGGNFLQFKWGVTVTNCHNPNSPDAFDACMTPNAPDSKESEHEFCFNLDVWQEATSHASTWWWACTVALLAARIAFAKCCSLLSRNVKGP
jgi:hypothetical protein